MAKVFSFDKARREAKQERIKFVKYGKEYSISPKIPAGILLEFELLKEQNKENDVPTDSMYRMFDYIFTKTVREELFSDGLDLEEMGEMIVWAMGYYKGDSVKDDDEEKESPKGNEGQE
jgi:hypothetical protein